MISGRFTLPKKITVLMCFEQHAEIPAKDEPSPPGQKRQRRSPEQAAPSMPGPAPSAPPGGASNPSPAGTMFPPNMMPNGLRQGPPFTPQMNAMGQMPPHGMMMPQGSMMQQMPQVSSLSTA